MNCRICSAVSAVIRSPVSSHRIHSPVQLARQALRVAAKSSVQGMSITFVARPSAICRVRSSEPVSATMISSAICRTLSSEAAIVGSASRAIMASESRRVSDGMANTPVSGRSLAEGRGTKCGAECSEKRAVAGRENGGQWPGFGANEGRRANPQARFAIKRRDEIRLRFSRSVRSR